MRRPEHSRRRRLSAQRRVIVRSGKGDAYREVPLNAEVRAAVDDWLRFRAGQFALLAAKGVPVDTDALWLSRTGDRLSPRSIDLVLRRLGKEAGLQLSAHTLPHTCFTSTFPSTISDEDLAAHFTLTPEDLAHVEQRRGERHRLGFALQLCTLRFLGFVPDDLSGAPAAILTTLANQLRIPLNTLDEYGLREHTRQDHRIDAMAALGFRSLDDPAAAALSSWLVDRALENEDDRRRINRQLNKGETLHGLRRFVFIGGEGKVRLRRHEDQTNQVSCLTLVTNAIVAWNTAYMAAALDELRAERHDVGEGSPGHLSPALHQHVNPYGKYQFDLDGAIRREGLRPLHRRDRTERTA